MWLFRWADILCQYPIHNSAISVANLNSSSTTRESETSFSQPSVTSAVVSPGTAETTFIQGVTSVTRPGHGYMRLSSASTALPPPTQPPPKPQTTRQRHSHQWTDSGLGQEPSSSVQVLSLTALCTLGKLQLEEWIYNHLCVIIVNTRAEKHEMKMHLAMLNLQCRQKWMLY